MKPFIYHYLIISIFLFIQIPSLHAHQSEKIRDRIAETQVNEISKQLGLDQVISENLGIFYKQYLAEIHQCSKSGKERHPFAVNDSITDEEAEKQILSQFKTARQILSVREKYYDLFKTLLTPKQIVVVFKMEHDFYRKLDRERCSRTEKRKFEKK